MAELTDFQNNCTEDVEKLLENYHVKYRKSTLNLDEQYCIINYLAMNGSLEANIYYDEPEFFLNSESCIYEIYDYPNENERITAFLQALESALQGTEPKDKGTARIVLLSNKKNIET